MGTPKALPGLTSVNLTDICGTPALGQALG